MTRHHHHSNARILGFHLPQHRQTIYFGHFHITQQDIHLVLLDVVEPLGSRGSSEHCVPLALENHFEGAQGAASIIHDQNSGHARRSSLSYMTSTPPMRPEACMRKTMFPDVSLPKAKR